MQKISTGYNVTGSIESVTSYAANCNVINQVKYEYGNNQKLARLYQSHGGAVNIFATSCLQYGYADVAHGLRLETMTYPSGKMLAYNYDDFGNVSAIIENYEPIVSYEYAGKSAVKTTYNEPNLSLNYENGGLDRFGRIVDHAWKQGTADVVRIQHGYDRIGNRLYRNDLVNTNNSEQYAYDDVNQIKSLDRTDLSESWNYDATGNWAQYNHNGVMENRSHNAANEVDVCTHDRNGNMMLMPNLKGKYDAWNRLVEVRDSSNNLIARYDYNGLNQRVQKVKDNVITHSYFNEQWQELETIESPRSPNGTRSAYVWGLRYIDDLIYRQRGAEKLYSLADPNWNVVAIADSTGAVQERLKYDAFGKVSGLTSDWNRTFTGQMFDSDTGLMLYRNRYYHTELGRFVTRDPIGYEAGDANLQRYIFNAVTVFVDPTGKRLPGQMPADCPEVDGKRTEKNGCTYTMYNCKCPSGYYSNLTGYYYRPLGDKPTVNCNKYPKKRKNKYDVPKPVLPVIPVVPVPEPVPPNVPWYQRIPRIPIRIPTIPIFIPEPILRGFDPTAPQQA